MFGRDNWQVGAYVRNVANETIAYELDPHECMSGHDARKPLVDALFVTQLN